MAESRKLPTPAPAPAYGGAGTAPRLHIDSLRVRVAGRSAEDGRRFGAALAEALATQGAELLSGAGAGSSIRLESLKLSVAAPDAGGASQAAGAAIVRAIARGARGPQGSRP